ncbi:MAG: bifunctional metallophosphatase/5'-nucleotidase, partial [Acholeplasmatales bacterium]|nr:bifunctional metallophosphatase/5'-nucleotidase [Acholeplasmatales bacterium]
MKKIFGIVLGALSVLTLASCGNDVIVINECSEREDIKILYTNDIHSYIANTTKDKEGNEVAALRLNNIAGYYKKLKNDFKNVMLVDAGDEVQGAIYGAIDRGVDMINIMNNVGYDLACPGNHDFDYGMDAFKGFVQEANYSYISCNFKESNGKNVLDEYKIFEIGGAKIGFVGISTPSTITTSTPTFFQNSKGEFIYTFDGQYKKEDLYNSVQETVDEIKNKVDYVIALGHLGVGIDEQKLGITSIDVINNTTGLDAFIDGHSHTLMEKKIVKSKDDKNVVLTQIGFYLESGFGVMDITKDGNINTTLVNNIEDKDDNVKNLEDALIDKVNNQLGQKIATLDKNLYIMTPGNDRQRIVRARETNMGNIASDSIYWYINESKKLDCDIAFVNGGGLRTGIDAGDVTYLSCKSVMPFGNQICLIKTKGINIKNAIEMGVNVVDGWNDEWNSPAENGGFIHAAGLKYDVDCNVPCHVKTDSSGMFVSVDGEYRVKNLMVYNKNTKEYEPLDDNKEYLLGGINYLLRNQGNGLTMFSDSEAVLDYIDEDYTVFAKYFMAFDNTKINNQNSPLKGYINYLYD